MLVLEDFEPFDEVPQRLDAAAHRVVEYLESDSLHESLGENVLIRLLQTDPHRFQSFALELSGLDTHGQG